MSSWGYLVTFEMGCGCRSLFTMKGDGEPGPADPIVAVLHGLVDDEVVGLLTNCGAGHVGVDGMNFSARARFCPDLEAATRAENARWEREKAERGSTLTVIPTKEAKMKRDPKEMAREKEDAREDVAPLREEDVRRSDKLDDEIREGDEDLPGDDAA
jgi:hypothetical protein